MSIDTPSSTDIHSNVTRCSLTPRNLGLSPGAVHEEYIKRDCTCAIERTVAPTTHGRPRNEKQPIRQATINMSK